MSPCLCVHKFYWRHAEPDLECTSDTQAFADLPSLLQERRIAAELGYPDPVNPTYDATTEMYYKVAELLLGRVAEDEAGGRVQVLFATHNEDTCKHIVKR